jgi:hypothetical protein
MGTVTGRSTGIGTGFARVIGAKAVRACRLALLKGVGIGVSKLGRYA